MSSNSNELLEKLKINDLVEQLFRTSSSDEQLKLRLKNNIEKLLADRELESYKKGYIQGGIDEILRHEQARQEVNKEIDALSPTKSDGGADERS